MPYRGAVQQIIAEFGKTIGIDDLSLDEEGYCCLVVDQDNVVNIELDEAAPRLLFYSIVGRPAEGRYKLLLEANYLGQGTGGGTLGLQPGSGAIVLSREVPLALLDVPTFSTALERFINLTEFWTRRLGEPAADLAALEYRPPPSGGIRA
ncbi:MAG: type III secretion system chaperone [Acetobacteraceae bacterium]